MPSEKMALSRRSFLKGRPLQKTGPTLSHKPILPWAKSSNILDNCSRCNLCITECPEGIIREGDGGFPTVEFKAGECVFCEKCAKICPEQVFDLAPLSVAAAWDLQAVVKSDCLAKNGVQCQACQDHCEVRAIEFDFFKQSIPAPSISTDKCTGCGACVSICPTNSILVISPNNLPQERGLE
ncbi:MAG: ferredoxin-type protein NapF [Sneathiella sp.]